MWPKRPKIPNITAASTKDLPLYTNFTVQTRCFGTTEMSNRKDVIGIKALN